MNLASQTQRGRFRRRLAWLILPIFVVGLSAEFYSGPGQAFFNNWLGDFLYQPFQILVLLFVFPRIASRHAALAVFAWNCLIEFSQLWKHPLLEHLRTTLFGRLFLGGSFSAEDFIAYAAGALTGWTLAVRAKAALKE